MASSGQLSIQWPQAMQASSRTTTGGGSPFLSSYTPTRTMVYTLAAVLTPIAIYCYSQGFSSYRIIKSISSYKIILMPTLDVNSVTLRSSRPFILLLGIDNLFI